MPSASKSKNAVPVKRVSPYPFSVRLTKNAQQLRGQVVKLTPEGLLIQIENIMLVGQEYECEFDLPADHGLVQAQIKIVKTYDKIGVKGPEAAKPPSAPGGAKPDPKANLETKVSRLVELRFLHLGEGHKDCIRNFLKAINQREH